MVTHLLDTSAWLAHILEETGMARVSSLLKDPTCKVAVSAPSIFELHGRLKSLGKIDRWNEIMTNYQKILQPFPGITETVALRAITLRQASPARIPAIDSLIAATASIHQATLVHCDTHFLSIPETLLKQELLTEN